MPDRDAPIRSPSLAGRLKESWQDECDHCQRRRLPARLPLRLRSDGVRLRARMGEADGPNAAECMLVVIGATPEGEEEPVGFQVDARESAQSRRELLVDPKARGPAAAPEIAAGDGAVGYRRGSRRGPYRHA